MTTDEIGLVKVKLVSLFCIALIFPVIANDDSLIESEFAESRSEFTLSQINDRVRGNSELIQANRLKIEGVEAQGRQAASWQNPVLAAELGRLKDTLNNNMTYDFRITQPIYFPGKLAKHQDVYSREADVLRVENDDLAESLSLEATYYAYAFSIAELKSSQISHRIKRMSLMRAYMRAQAYASPAKVIERNIVTNQLIVLQKSLNSSRAEAESSWQKLNIYLNQKEKIKILTPWLNELKEIDIVDFLNKVRVGNRRLKAKKIMLTRLEAEKSLQKAVPLPDVSLSAFYRQEAIEHPGSNQFFGGAITVPIPLLNTNRAGIEAVENKLSAAKSEQKYLQREVLQLARTAHAEYTQEKKLFDNFDPHELETLEQQMRYADRELKLGRIDLLSYLELELKTHEALSSYYEAELQLVKVISQMIYLMGDSAIYQGDLYIFQVH